MARSATRRARLPAAVLAEIKEYGDAVYRDSVAAGTGKRPARKAGAIDMAFTKLDEEKRLVWGWASVIEEGGVPVIDSQGSIIKADTLQRAAHKFMVDARKAGFMHLKGETGRAVKVGEIVESCVFTRDVQKALGIDLGRVGWWICVKILDDEIWEMVKAGTLRAFSIGGRARVVEV